MKKNPNDIHFEKLIEREKELNCLYTIENLLIRDDFPLDHILQEMIKAIPPGWQHPASCACRIKYEDQVFKSEDFTDSEQVLSSDIVVDQHVSGKIEVLYTRSISPPDEQPFLPEEQKLLHTITGTLGKTIFRRKLKTTLAYLNSSKEEKDKLLDHNMVLNQDSDQHWKWRYEMTERIAEHLDLDRFGLKGIYIIGSTKNACAGPGSDIDIMVHSTGNLEKETMLKRWMEGWGFCLGEINYIKSGYRTFENMIDLHIITDEDIRKKTSYACLINAVTDRARPIKIKD